MSQPYALPYGKETLDFSLPDSWKVEWIAPAPVPAAGRPAEEVERALDSVEWQAFRGARSAAIAINDKTRPVPLGILLPPLLQRLEALAIPPEHIRLFFATGTHTPLTGAEMAALLPPALAARYPLATHDCDDAANLVSLGVTARGTNVLCSRKFLSADLKIVTGNIEPHHFAGFSGGAKTFSIGLAGRQTIDRNHSLLLEAHARTGEYELNPLRQDIEEIGRMGGIDLALNVVLNEKKEIVRAFCGAPLTVMQAGIPLARQVCQTPTHGPYDVVLASVGGHPKDINLYQAQKALTHAAMLTHDGGVVILVAACPEGSGSQGYETLMTQSASAAAALAKFDRVDFHVGPHKAFQFARELVRIQVILVSQMPENLVRRLHLIPAGSAGEAVRLADGMLPPAPRAAVMPRAINTIPLLPTG